MDHVRALAALKSRTAGTPGESRAIRYVHEQLRHAAVDVQTESFLFRSYHLDRATLRVGAVSVQPIRVEFDPYQGATEIRGRVALLTAAMANGESGMMGDLSQRIVVTTGDARDYRIAAHQPAAIVFVSDNDFERLKPTAADLAELVLNGQVRTLRSANLVATTRNSSALREIIVSAHVDSAGTPGAQDNASGVAVLLELARTLPKLHLPYRLRFVFFGAEEFGLLGSQAYLDHHREDLQRCALLFNMDSVGGRDIWIDMRDGVQNLPPHKAFSRHPQEDLDKADDDFTGRWTLLRTANESSDTSNVPPWLQQAIRDSARELGYRINEGRGASSDHRTFAAAGIVATDIAIGGIKSHTPDDVPAQIIPSSLEQAARIVTGVVIRSIAALNSPASTQTIQ
ncbi:MAG TPA: M20/M25/M40 family metallo-hydrolase [Bryobacteraceae bacterium]|nr:M20/M25/M40 family metallo-hydrolase [Bryobacteraceae bacterium]